MIPIDEIDRRFKEFIFGNDMDLYPEGVIPAEAGIQFFNKQTSHSDNIKKPQLREDFSISTGPGPASVVTNIDLISAAIHLEAFLATIFPIKDQLDEHKQRAEDFDIIYEFKRNFIQRRALRIYPISASFDDVITFSHLPVLEFAKQVRIWRADPEKYVSELDAAAKYCAYKVYFDADSVAFQIPQKLDFDRLVTESALKVTDALDQSHYCIFCHKQEKDSCRTGLHDGANVKTNPLGNKMTGCPLGQQVSEMNLLYSTGNVVAALAVVMKDNPLVAATGDRICNDCMKSCIYQKQEPVDIPRIESQMLKDVLSLPFGAEIYYLLSRWNPLAKVSAIASLSKRYLIVGLGPAGFAMAYYLLNQGHHVTAIDGLDITPLPLEFLQPIENWPKLINDLGVYKPQGFGGVAEYGITDRWDKYNLLLIRMLLERYPNFEMKGNFRLGRDITIKDAIEKGGYDYVSLCLGAGRPKGVDIANIDAKGVISAFTFLASLHMNKPDFQYKMPVVIIGAGLTAMDSAMAALKYNNDVYKDVTIIYRKSMQDSPSYKENHHELQMTLDLGVKFIENTDLESIEADALGNIVSINKNIAAGTLIYSIGTHPNDTIFATESETFALYKDKIGIFGDMDPKYAGTVVKAIASIRDWVNAQTSW